MPTIGNLHRIGRTLARTVGIHSATIAADNLHARMLVQPLRNTLCRTLWQQVNRLMGLQIDHNRRITLAFAFGPIVDAYLGWRGRGGDGRLAHRIK
jgi:hypothetical protein